jgi:hypothetical protein
VRRQRYSMVLRKTGQRLIEGIMLSPGARSLRPFYRASLQILTIHKALSMLSPERCCEEPKAWLFSRLLRPASSGLLKEAVESSLQDYQTTRGLHLHAWVLEDSASVSRLEQCVIRPETWV